MTYEDDFDDEQENQPLDPNIRKQLREADKARKELETLKAQVELERRETFFAKVGIPESGAGALFRKAYDGDASLEAIRSEAEKYGILQSAQEARQIEEASYDSELEAQRRAQGATVGSTGATPDMSEEVLAALAEAKTPEDVMRVVQSGSGQKVGMWTSRSAF